MNNKMKKLLSVTAVTVGILYFLFLISPLVITPIIRKYNSQIVEIVKSSTGLDVQPEKLSFTASWNLKAGIKAEKVVLSLPTHDNKKIIEAENIGGNISLLPLLARKIRLGNLYAKNISASIDIKEDGNLLILDYLPKTEDEETEPFALPFGLKLSDKLPNICIEKYNFAIIDMNNGKRYYTEGENFKISDFIINKKVKLTTKGKVVFDENVVSNYDIKIFNKIMPDITLQELVFPEKAVALSDDTPSANPLPFNIIDILNSIVNNQFSADLTTDIKIKGNTKTPELNGFVNISALSAAVDGKRLPEGFFNLSFKGDNTNIDSLLYSSFDKKETTQIIGSVKTGKKPYIDLTFRSNAKFNNIINLIDSVAKSFNINDLETLSATGGIDANFNISSDMKKVNSNGYLNILPSKITYGLYNVSIDNITADINFDNGIDIRNAGFSILNHPLSLVGTIKQDSTTDLKLAADKISLRGLLAAIGQFSLLKDNNISSGEISLNALIKGKLAQLKPELIASLNNLKIYNTPSLTSIGLTKLYITANYDGKKLLGDIDILDFIAKNGTISIKIPDTCILMDTKDINIKQAYVLLNNSRIDITGAIKDYISDKLSINITAKGNIQSADIAALLPKEFVSLIAYTGKLPLSLDITGNSKVQNIKFNMDADKNNYVSLIDIDKLNNKSAKIKSTVEIIGNSLQIRDTGLYEGNNTIAKASGEITNLNTVPKLNITASVPEKLSFPVWGVPNSNISAQGGISVGGTINKPTISGNIRIPDISMKDFDFAITDLSVDLAGAILHGNATAKQIKAGGIIATDLSGKLSLKDYNLFTLTDISGKAFDGNVKGKLSYEINTAKIGLDLKGEGLNSSKAVYGAVGIKDALTGILNFNAKLAMQGLTDIEIIKSMKGNVTFDIKNGKFINIGRIEGLVAAQNVTSNSILKSAISQLSGLAAIQEADKFKSITGDISLSNGNANLTKILVEGALMSYYVSGTYNILDNTANLVILGRLDSKVISMLGVLGELSVDRLLSSIPKLGALTSTIWKNLTSDSNNENISLIPPLAGGSENYKDFKVSYIGSVGAASSVKYFKWLSSTVDNKDIDIKQDLQGAKEAVKENVKTKVEQAKNDAQTVKNNVKNVVETQKNKVQTIKENANKAKENLQESKNNSQAAKDNLKNLFQNAVKNSVKTPPATSPATETAPTTADTP